MECAVTQIGCCQPGVATLSLLAAGLSPFCSLRQIRCALVPPRVGSQPHSVSLKIAKAARSQHGIAEITILGCCRIADHHCGRLSDFDRISLTLRHGLANPGWRRRAPVEFSLGCASRVQICPGRAKGVIHPGSLDPLPAPRDRRILRRAPSLPTPEGFPAPAHLAVQKSLGGRQKDYKAL